ncbi:MAG: hypothetical protein IH626_06910 [Rhodospirillales bacterium]|nr:hypothetical protein [Rhodospirillales bacterium]
MTKSILAALAAATIAIGAAGCAELELGAGPIYHDPYVAERLDAEDNFMAGRAQFAVGHFGLALTHLRRADRERPGDIGILNAMGAAYDRIGRIDLAQRAYAQALVLEPESPQTLNNYGYSLLLARRYEEAAAILAEAYERGQSSPFAATIRANLRLLQSRTGPRPTVVAGEDIVITLTDNLERTHALQRTAADRHALRIGYLLPAPVRPVTAQPIAPPPPSVAEKDEPLIHTVPPSRAPNEVVAAVARPSQARKALRPVPEAAEDDEDRTVAFWRYETIGETHGGRPSSLPGRPARSPQMAGRREGQAWRRAGNTTKEAT